MALTTPTPTTTTFTTRLTLEPTRVVEITLTGSGLKYDKSGAIVAGEIYDISLGQMKASTYSLSLIEANKAFGLNISVARLTELFGTPNWNDAKTLYSTFDKLAHLHEGIAQGYFSAGKSYIEGTGYSDELTGSNFNERIMGGDGDDVLHGGFGQDTIFGGGGDDVLYGDYGNDLMIDSDGNNSFYGGSGANKIRGGTGVDQIWGGAGADLMDGGGGIDTLAGGSGADRFVFDLKSATNLKIGDFAVAEDQLVNLRMGSAEEAWKDFVTHAHQDGRHVVYDEGEVHMVLRYVQLEQLTLRNFGDPSLVLESGLY